MGFQSNLWLPRNRLVVLVRRFPTGWFLNATDLRVPADRAGYHSSATGPCLTCSLKVDGVVAGRNRGSMQAEASGPYSKAISSPTGEAPYYVQHQDGKGNYWYNVAYGMGLLRRRLPGGRSSTRASKMSQSMVKSLALEIFS